MKKKYTSFVLFILLLPVISYANTIYYVDNVSGNDNNSGKSKQTAWKTLGKLNTVIFQAGDQIYLRRGQVFKGYLHLKGSGKDGSSIKLAAFGTGNRPIINAGKHESAIRIMDADHWEISDIETTGGDKAGIYIGCTKDGLLLNHFRITNCYVHDIGDTSKIDWDYSKSTGGIIVVNGDFDKDGKPLFYNTVFNDVVIDGCIVRFNYRWTCFSISSGKNSSGGGTANYIKNCTTEFSVADAIRMNGVRNSFIEYCVMYRNGAWPKPGGRNLGGLGAWFFDADSCTIQFCEAGYIRGNTTDAGAFDIDYWQKNSTVQYSYGHHCAGYGVSVFGADPTFPTENSIVRYNVFTNNGRDTALAFQGDFFVFTWSGGLLNGVKIHDNLSIWRPVKSAASLKHEASYTGNNPNSFTNNIIYSDTSWLAFSKNDTLKMDNNIWWTTKPTPVWTDPKNKYHSLKEWQQASGQDMNGRYTQPSIKIPAWYKYPLPATAFRNTNDGRSIQRLQKMPGFTAITSNGKKINLSDYKGKLVLISFISYPSSQAQLTFIKSMQRQYEEKGLKIILIDESYITNKNLIVKDQIKNFVSDHELENITLIQDNNSINLATKYSVTVSPTTFLVSGKGIVLNRWENLALPAELAFAIEDALKK